MAFLLLAVSCKSPYQINVSAGHDASEADKGNFIKMKKGAEVKLADNIDIKRGDLEVDNTRMIKVDNKKYKGVDVAELQINGDYYVNSGRKAFARRIYKGDFDVFTQTKTSTSSTRSSVSPATSMQTYSTQIFSLRNPKINSGALEQIRLTGTGKAIEPYIKSYQPSMDILKKYQEQRKISRIVKFSVAGLWLSSIAVAATAKGGTTLSNVAIANTVLGFVYVPVFAYTFKMGNHKRQFKAVQNYIDNNISDAPITSIPAKAEKAKDLGSVANQPNVETQEIKDPKLISSDFLELNNNQIVVANEGTKLKSANNKIFLINGQKYTSGVTAFQISKKYFRHFTDMKKPEDFAQRSVSGKISAYNVVKGTSQNISNVNSRNMFVGKKNTYFTKEGVDGFIKKRQSLDSYFEDNKSAYAQYQKYTKEYSKFKTTYFALLGVSVGAFVGAATLALSSESISSTKLTTVNILSAVGLGTGIGNYFYIRSKVPKLNKQFVKSLDAYNGTSKSKTKRNS